MIKFEHSSCNAIADIAFDLDAKETNSIPELIRLIGPELARDIYKLAFMSGCLVRHEQSLIYSGTQSDPDSFGSRVRQIYNANREGRHHGPLPSSR